MQDFVAIDFETANGKLKNKTQIKHSMHRSFFNFITNALSAVAAYYILPEKPYSFFGFCP